MEIPSEVSKVAASMVADRRNLHKHPELGFHEEHTAGFIVQRLESLGWSVKSAVGKTGILAEMHGNRPGANVLLRFDMDALPVQEENSHDFISEVPGVMHACGHDGHMAVGLALAKILSQKRESWPGFIRLVFQPAEEIGAGARAMLAEGAAASPRPDFALAAHLWAEQPVGWFGLRPGAMMAAAHTFHVRVLGRGGHAGRPQNTADPIAAAAQIVSALQTIVSRNLDPTHAAVLSITQIHGGSADNIIPEETSFSGTLRTFLDADLRLIEERLRQIAVSVAEGMGCRAEVVIQQDTIAVVNDEKVVSAAVPVIRELYPNAEIDLSYQTMMAEDMAYFLDLIPGMMILVGAGKSDRSARFPHHHPRFDIDETALSSTVAVLLGTALKLLNQPVE